MYSITLMFITHVGPGRRMSIMLLKQKHDYRPIEWLCRWRQCSRETTAGYDWEQIAILLSSRDKITVPNCPWYCKGTDWIGWPYDTWICANQILLKLITQLFSDITYRFSLKYLISGINFIWVCCIYSRILFRSVLDKCGKSAVMLVTYWPIFRQGIQVSYKKNISNMHIE